MNIDKNHPVPADRKMGRPVKWPFSKMDVGDSFLASWVDKYGSSPTQPLKASWQSNMSANAARHKPKQFTTQVDHEAQGVRVWRVS